jgi:sugar phosphate isomerase/epimerase
MVDVNKLKIAAYLDEPDDDPAHAGQVLVDLNINHVCLRRAWRRNIDSMPDQACELLKSTLDDHKLQPLILLSSVGDVEHDRLLSTQNIDFLTRCLDICTFFGCKGLCVGLGKSPATGNWIDKITQWMKVVDDKALESNIQPLFEVSHQSAINEPAIIVQLMVKHKRWRLIYDPANLVMLRMVNPYLKYWSLLKNMVSYFDIHDHKTGDSARPPGHGDCGLDLTINDTLVSGYKGWYCMEPGLGRRYGDKLSRRETFEYAFQTFHQLVSRVAGLSGLT